MTRVLVNKPQPLEARFAQERDRVQAAFGKRLREFRVEKQLTLEMLAERADLHANYVGAVERGERNLSLYNIWRLAQGLGLPADELMQELPTRKGKLGADMGAHAQVTSDAQVDILQALLALGYNDKEAAAALKALPPDVGVSDGIKLALKALAK